MPLREHSKAIDGETLDILSRSVCAGNTVKLPDMLPRAQYERVDKVLRALGGQWDRRSRSHIFPYEAKTLLETATRDGTYIDRKQTLQLFETPPELAVAMVTLAQIKRGGVALEPSAGTGNIVRPLLSAGARVIAVDIDAQNFSALAQIDGCEACHADFLTWGPQIMHGGFRFDAAVMNPPFSDGQDMAHIRAAYDLVRLGGRLVSICGEGAFFRQDVKAQMFREWLKRVRAEDTPLDRSTFASAGTAVLSRMIVIKRPS